MTAGALGSCFSSSLPTFVGRGRRLMAKQQCLLGLWEASVVRWVFYPSFFKLVVLNMNPFAALLEEISHCTENKPGFSYPSDNHSDRLGYFSEVFEDGGRR